jgi:hypothetical protein
VHHIRDGYYAWPSSSPIVKAHQQLADIGIKCTYVIPFNTSTTSDAIENFAGMVGDVEALESPNECDDPGNCGATAQAGIQNAVAFLPTLSTAAKNLNVPLLGPSFIDPASYSATGNISSEITYNNLHVYFGGRNPGSTGWGDFDPQGNSYGSFAFWLDQAAIDGPGLPSVLTETGYMSYPSTTTPFTLPESVAASYVPRTLLLSYMHGIKRTHIYELLDEVSSPGYGLLHGDLSPKPAFNAVKNLLDLLADPGASGFTPGSLQYSISGGGASLNRLLLQKSDGSFLLVLWLEKSSWDAANAVPVAVAAQSITLNLTDSYFAATSYQFDTTGNSTPSTPSMDENSTSLSVTDQLTIVKIALR